MAEIIFLAMSSVGSVIHVEYGLMPRTYEMYTASNVAY